MQPGEINPQQVEIVDAAGAGVTGLTLSDLTISAYARGYGASIFTTWTHGSVMQSLGSGQYDLAWALPPSAGKWRYRAKLNNPAYRFASNNQWEGETETQDADSLFGSVVRPVATLSQSAQLGMPLPLELVAYRYRTLTIPVVDQSGAAYTNLATDFPSATLRMSVRSKNQVSTVWDAGPSATPTGFVITTSGSTLSITIPEDATFFGALATGVDSVDDLYWEVTGDLGSDSTKTQPIIRSSNLRLTRREVGS